MSGSEGKREVSPRPATAGPTAGGNLYGKVTIINGLGKTNALAFSRRKMTENLICTTVLPKRKCQVFFKSSIFLEKKMCLLPSTAR